MKTPFLHQARALLVAALLPLATAAAAESPSLLLEKGIYAEEVERNLDSAIKIYEQIAAESAANRAVVAQAQYRLAVCYQKQGKKEQAIRLLNELVQSASDASVSKKAKETLAELGVNPATTLSARRIPLPLPTTWLMSMSADGRFVSYQPKGSYDIAVLDLGTGKTWIAVKGTKEKKPLDVAKFSRDGQWIAYQLSLTSLTVAKIDGSETRTVYENSCWLDDWWPDSRHIMLWATPAAEKSAALIPVYSLDIATGAKREFGRVPRGGSLDIAPDGASAVRVLDEAYPRRIALWNFKTAKEEILVNRQAGDFYGWFANGTKILYSKRRIEGTDLLAISVKDGRPQGEPEHIWTIPGEVWPMGIGDDGTVYYCTPNDTSPTGKVDQCLWAIDGLLSGKVPVVSRYLEIPPDELLGSDNSILDRKFDLSFKFPKDWTILDAERAENQQDAGIGFRAPLLSKGYVRIYYALIDKADRHWMPSDIKPTTASGIDAWLYESARLKAVQRIEQEHLSDYKNRAESFVSRTIGGHPALSYSADFTRQDSQKWIEHHTKIYGKDTIVSFWIRCPAGDLEAIKPVFEEMVGTLRLP